MLRDLFALEPAYRSQLFLSLHLLGQSRLVRRLSNTPLLFLLFPDLLERPTDVLFSLDLELVEKLPSNIIFPWVGVGRLGVGIVARIPLVGG